jgi:hypothetical protein
MEFYPTSTRSEFVIRQALLDAMAGKGELPRSHLARLLNAIALFTNAFNFHSNALRHISQAFGNSSGFCLKFLNEELYKLCVIVVYGGGTGGR